MSDHVRSGMETSQFQLGDCPKIHDVWILMKWDERFDEHGFSL